jgi:alpha-L-fucosidase
MKVNGESIYGTRGGPWKPGRYLSSTRKGHVVYLHIFQAKGGQIELPSLPRKIKAASCLGGGKIMAETSVGKTVINLPASQGSFPTVIKLQLDGSPMDIAAMNVQAN